MAITGLIFDFGGVLWDMRWDVSASLAAEHGLEELAIVETLYASETWRQLAVGVGDREAWQRESHARLEALAGRPLPPLHQHWRESQRWIEPNLDLIRRLRPPYKTAVLSNADRTLRERFVEKGGALELFDLLVCSGEVGVAKPDPRVYALTAERLGAPAAECVFIDDSERNVDAARAAGMEAVYFRIDEGHDLEAQLAELGVRARIAEPGPTETQRYGDTEDGLG
jgi:HAD superfamily hydrolase (TIGR01509 family)